MKNRLDQQLCFAAYSASRSFTRAYAPLLSKLGLTYPQYIVMLVLWEQDGLSVRELGQRLGLDSGTLTPLLKRLAEARIVARTRDADDERVVRIALTARGRKLEAAAQKIPEQLFCRAGFEPTTSSMKELARLRDTLHALSQRLDASLEQPPPPRRRRAGL